MRREYGYNLAMANERGKDGFEKLRVLAHPVALQIAACLIQGSHSAAELQQATKCDLDQLMERLDAMVAAGIVECEGTGIYGVYSFLPEVCLAALSENPDATIDFGCCQLTLTQITDGRKKSPPPEAEI
jgi:hypothetical protein